MKKIWITSLIRDEKLVIGLMGTARKYGLDANGHFWMDDLKNMAWQTPSENILHPDTGLWVILGSEKELATPSVRYGLSLLTLTIQARKGLGFHILWIATQEGLKAEALPTPLRGAEIAAPADPAIGAKLTARANTPPSRIDSEYRLDIHSNPGFGVWLETGPAKGKNWSGSLLGVRQGSIDAHGVGEAGKLPTKSVLEYPMKGLKLKLGEKEYTAWAVKNEFDENASYYVRLKDLPGGVVFGPLAQGDEAEVHSIEL